MAPLDILAQGLAVSDGATLTEIVWNELAVTRLIAKGHALSAHAANNPTLQERRSLSGRVVASVFAVGLGAGVQRL